MSEGRIFNGQVGRASNLEALREVLKYLTAVGLSFRQQELILWGLALRSRLEQQVAWCCFARLIFDALIPLVSSVLDQVLC